MLKDLIAWYSSSLDAGGYPLIVLLMAMESSVVPLPSELVIPPAALLAQQHGRFSMVGIVIAAAIGSWIGATVMYWVSRVAGRPLVVRYGHYLMVSPEKVRKAEIWAAQFGSMGIFVSRLLPVVRHLIGIPAGIVRMNYRVFSIYTLIGSAIWSGVLCWVGVMAGRDERLMRGELRQVTLWVAGACIILGTVYYYFVHRHMTGPDTKPPSRENEE